MKLTPETREGIKLATWATAGFLVGILYVKARKNNAL